MDSNALRRIEKIIKSDFQENFSTPYYLNSSVPPMRIIAISEQLPELNLRTENVLLIVDVNPKATFLGLVLTDKFLHLPNEKAIPVDQATAWIENSKEHVLMKDLSQGDQHLLGIVFNKVFNEEQPEEVSKGKSFDDYVKMIEKLGERFEEKANEIKDRRSGVTHSVERPQKKENSKETTADSEVVEIVDEAFLALLSEEGDKFFEMINTLNEDKDFIKVMHQAFAISDKLTDDFKTEHLVIQDIIKIFNLMDAHSDLKEKKSQFALAYMFERLQGKDMAQKLSLNRLNQMVASDKYDDNIQTLKNAVLVELPSEYADQLALPSLMVRLKHDLSEKVSTHYYRYASVIAKADGELSKSDEEVLKKISKLSSSPKRKLANVKQTEVPEGETLEDVMKELNQLYGLSNIKEDISDLINYLKVQKMRAETGLSNVERSLHAVFMGPPGTGKTTIARLLSRIYKHLDYLESGHLVETDRAGLVAGYVGQTALKVDEVVTAAIDGVLFIDEAYSLTQGENKRDFGNEAVETLLKRMEDHRDDLVVIAAGYPDEMKSFIQSNPGLQSRFNRFFTFNHYTGEELLAIYKIFAKKADFVLSAEAEEKLSFIFDELYEKRNAQFGNARVVRNIFEQCISRQANRVVSITPLTKEILMKLEEPDIPPVKETVKKVLVFEENESSK